MCDHAPDVKSKKTPTGGMLQLHCLECQEYGDECTYTTPHEAKLVLDAALKAWGNTNK